MITIPSGLYQLEAEYELVYCSGVCEMLDIDRFAGVNVGRSRYNELLVA